MSELYTATLECCGECGTKIELTSREKKDVHQGTLHSVAELLGWTTRDKPGRRKVREVLVFCPFCQQRADLIVNGK